MALANDTISPVGGSPVPLAAMLGLGDQTNKRGDQSKDVTDFLIRRDAGVEPPHDRAAQLLVEPGRRLSDRPLQGSVRRRSRDRQSGRGAGRQRLVAATCSRAGPTLATSKASTGCIKRDFNGDVLEASYRYMTDDWGVDSHTVELRYRWSFGTGSYLQPHVRFYQQDGRGLLSHGVVQRGAVADVRYGGSPARRVRRPDVRREVRSRDGWRRRVVGRASSTTRRRASRAPGSAVGALAGLDLYPDLNALIAQFSYKFGRR